MITIYADDTNAIVSASTAEDLNIKINNTLQVFDNWFTKNNLILNVKKTSAMLFRTNTRDVDALAIRVNGLSIDTLDTVKFLGIHIDRDLNRNKEIEALKSSLSSACYALRTLRDEINLSQLKSVYYALVESKLRYSIMFWGNSYQYNISAAFVTKASNTYNETYSTDRIL